MAKKNTLRKDLEKIWKASQKELDNISRETGKLLKKGEEQLKKVTAESQKKMGLVNATVAREKLYYQLGKTLGSKSVASWRKSKKAASIAKQISRLSKEIKALS
jgi:hypothetical protein